MKVKVIATPKNPTTINNKPVKVGDVVEVDKTTLLNLCRKGVVEPHDAEAKDVDLKERSVLGEAQAEAQIEDQVEAKKAKKSAEDAAKEK